MPPSRSSATLTEEAWGRLARARLELGMELGGYEERVVLELYYLHAPPGLVLNHHHGTLRSRAEASEKRVGDLRSQRLNAEGGVTTAVA